MKKKKRKRTTLAKNKGSGKGTRTIRAYRKGRLRPQDEKFCRAVALEGQTAVQAYLDHIATKECKRPTAQHNACDTLRHPLIQERIERLREMDKRAIEEKLGFGREQLARFYVDALQTPVGDVDQDHPLCQEYTVTVGEHSTTTKLKMVGKLEAGKALAQMAGWVGGGGSGEGKAPQVTINLGAVFSPSPNSPPLTAVRVVDDSPRITA